MQHLLYNTQSSTVQAFCPEPVMVHWALHIFSVMAGPSGSEPTELAVFALCPASGAAYSMFINTLCIRTHTQTIQYTSTYTDRPIHTRLYTVRAVCQVK